MDDHQGETNDNVYKRSLFFWTLRNFNRQMELWTAIKKLDSISSYLQQTTQHIRLPIEDSQWSYLIF